MPNLQYRIHYIKCHGDKCQTIHCMSLKLAFVSFFLSFILYLAFLPGWIFYLFIHLFIYLFIYFGRKDVLLQLRGRKTRGIFSLDSTIVVSIEYFTLILLLKSGKSKALVVNVAAHK